MKDEAGDKSPNEAATAWLMAGGTPAPDFKAQGTRGLPLEEMKTNSRKPNRLIGFNYAQTGAYFITVCTKDRQCILSRIVENLSDKSVA